jgi:outer membrane protein OmpA-like peptidoglycan-associated protein
MPSNRVTRSICAALAVVVIVTAGAGCTTRDPYTREEKVSHAGRGAGIGAAAGAAVGALTGVAADEHVARNALIGAGVGALGGAAVGHYMDRQEAQLRRRLDETGVRVKREGNRIRLIMPGNVTFAVDSARLRPRFDRVLADVGLVLEEFQKTYVRVEGHTDSQGPTDYNRRLSRRRAQSVAKALIDEGVRSERFIIRAFGETQPIASNTTASGRQRNRRAEIELVPHTKQG